MNKQKFVDYLRSPERLTEGQFDELQKLLTDYPYFSIAKSIAARGAKDLELDSKNQFITSAAIYATDRKHLKKYINGELVFLVDPPKINEETIEETPPEKTVPKEAEADHSTVDERPAKETKSSIINEVHSHVPTGSEVDQVLDELQRDIKELEKSRMHFLEIQDHLDDVKFTNKITPEIDEPEASEEVTEPEARTEVEETPEEPIAEVTKTKVSKKETETAPEPKAKPASEVETEKEVESKKKESSKPSKESAKKDFGLDLEALKREFALETDSKKEKEEPSIPKEPKIIANMDEEDEEDEEDAMFFPPPPVDSPNAITNMSPDEEEPDDEAEIIQKLPKSEKRKPRKAIKMKRGDFEKILGKKSESEEPEVAEKKGAKEEIQSIEKDEPQTKAKKAKDEKEVDEEPIKEKTTKAKKTKPEKETETAEAKPVKEVEKPETTELEEKKEKVKEEPSSQTESRKSSADKDDKVKEAMSKMDKASSISKSNVSKRKKNTPKRDPESDVVPIEIIKSEPKKTSKPKSAAKKEPNQEENEEMAGRNSVKSFLELGRSNESTSISRASTSKRRTRTNKSKPAGGDASKSSGGKDDDESGRASSLIDKFITENPSIQRREIGDEKSDLSEESVKWHPELASEYLAQIYVDQGNKARAITIYEALSLKFPEKKSYFAGLIKKLKK